jgi:hypothetical protein
VTGGAIQSLGGWSGQAKPSNERVSPWTATGTATLVSWCGRAAQPAVLVRWRWCACGLAVGDADNDGLVFEPTYFSGGTVSMSTRQNGATVLRCTTWDAVEKEMSRQLVVHSMPPSSTSLNVMRAMSFSAKTHIDTVSSAVPPPPTTDLQMK